jgi:hypothetical protein
MDCLGIRNLSVLGTVATCPFCNQDRIVFHQHAHSGYRYSASCCKLSGSIVELVSTLKKLDPVRASQLLTDWGFGQLANPEPEPNYRELETVWQAGISISDMLIDRSGQVQMIKSSGHVTRSNIYNHPGLSGQLRAIRLGTLRSLVRHQCLQIKSLDLPESAYLFMMPGYSYPGYLCSLVFMHYTRPGQYRLVSLKLNQDSDDLGVVCHLDASQSGEPMVLCRDPGWYIRTVLWHADNCQTSGPIGLLLDHPAGRSLTCTTLRYRPSVIWTPELDGQSIRHAIRHQSQLTRFGHTASGPDGRVLKQLNPGNLYADLSKRSTDWRQHLKDLSSKPKALELIRVSQDARLTKHEIHEIGLEPGIRDLLESETPDGFRNLQVQVSNGILEQTPEGWMLYRGGTAQRISSYSWRISRVLDGPEPCYEVQVYDRDGWVSFQVPVLRFEATPYRYLTHLTARAGMMPFSAVSRYQGSAIHYAKLFHAPSRQTGSIQRLLGLDPDTGLLQASRVSVKKDPARIVVHAGQQIGQSNFMPRADDRLPDSRKLSGLIGSRFTSNILNGAVLQAVGLMTGTVIPSVVVDPHKVPACRLVLDGLGILNSPVWPFCLKLLSGTDKRKGLVAALRGRDGVWVTAGSRIASWASCVRPVWRIGGRPAGELDLCPETLQRTFVQLYYRTVKQLGNSISMANTAALSAAWRDLIESVYPESSRPEPNRIDGLMGPSAGLSFWVRDAVLNGKLKIRYRRKTIWRRDFLYVSNQHVTFTREVINDQLSEYGLPRLDTGRLMEVIQRDPDFVKYDNLQNKTLLTFRASWLDVQYLESKLAGRREAS